MTVARRAATVWISILLATGALAACGGSTNGLARAGQVAPPLAAPTITGGRVDLAGSLRGHPAVVLFGADWCDPCRHDWPLVVKALPRYPGVVAVGVAYQTSRSLMTEFVHKIGVQFPVADDPNGTIAERWRVHRIPTTFFVSARGRIVARVDELPTAAELDQHLRTLEG